MRAIELLVLFAILYPVAYFLSDLKTRCLHEDQHLEWGRGLVCDDCDESVEPRK